ncbi:hypothetical protein RA210_U550001 [Rubrivivax sp. A210]|nr:hypothetical protein RA210_U550001 [Rubrivivax sp. A210]
MASPPTPRQRSTEEGHPAWPAFAAQKRWRPRAGRLSYAEAGRRGSATKSAQDKACISGRQKRGLTRRSS